MKRKLTKFKKEIDHSTIVGEFNILLSVIDRIIRQKIHKEIDNWNNTMKQLDLRSIHRTLCPTTAEYIFFSTVRGMFST